MRRIIAVVDPDTDYALKLADYINRHGTGGFKAVSFSCAESYTAHAAEYDTGILLIDEGELSRLKGDIKCAVICLSEDRFSFSLAASVCKYSRADFIVDRMLEEYCKASGNIPARTSVRRSRIIMIYSPIGRCGKTSFAITAANCLGSRSKCLLLCLDEFSGVFRFIGGDAALDLSDVIYAFMKGGCSWALFSRAVRRFGNTDYIAPVRYPEDADALDAACLTELVETVAKESGYENIVIDAGGIGRRAAGFLELADEIFVPTKPKNELKLEEFEACLKADGREDVLERLRHIELPFEEKYETAMLKEDDYSYGAMCDFTRNLFANTRQSDASADGYARCDG